MRLMGWWWVYLVGLLLEDEGAIAEGAREILSGEKE